MEVREMAQMLVTQKGHQVLADGINMSIYLPKFEDWVLVDESEREKKGEGSLWNPNMARSFSEFKGGKNVDLAGGYQIRIGWSVALMTPKGPVFVEYDSTHPLNPNKLTPPAGMWKEYEPEEAALKELGEEIIIKRGNEVGFWSFKESLIAEEWVREYAKEHCLSVVKDLIIKITNFDNFFSQAPTVSFIFGGVTDYKISGLPAIGAESGALEGIILFDVIDRELLNGIELVDGEKLLNGRYLHRRVFFGNFTTKAQEVIKALVL